MTVIDGQTELM